MYRKQFIRGTLAAFGLGAVAFFGTLGNNVALGQAFDVDAFNDAVLSEHNTYRATHHSPAMTLDDSLESTAQAWAETLQSNRTFFHGTYEQRNGAGENLFRILAQPGTMTPEALAERAVEAWYEEVADYNYSNPGFSVETGHFTQVVWKSSTNLGCGVAVGSEQIAGRTADVFYVACHYAPDGNSGSFPENVLQP